MSKVCRFDTSGHRVSFVTVEPRVHVDVLDWDGKGETLVLLTGLGDNAHVFDQCTIARDDIAVLNKLNIREAVFVGTRLPQRSWTSLVQFIQIASRTLSTRMV
jgi:hypothetical protein